MNFYMYMIELLVLMIARSLFYQCFMHDQHEYYYYQQIKRKQRWTDMVGDEPE